MNTIVENRIRQIAERMLEITSQFNRADHVDVKIFIDSIYAKRYRNELIELCLLANELNSIDELKQSVESLEVIECGTIEDLAQTASLEYYCFMRDLTYDIAEKIEKRGRNTYHSSEENYRIAKWFNDGLSAKTNINLYQRYLDSLQ